MIKGLKITGHADTRANLIAPKVGFGEMVGMIERMFDSKLKFHPEIKDGENKKIADLIGMDIQSIGLEESGSGVVRRGRKKTKAFVREVRRIYIPILDKRKPEADGVSMATKILSLDKGDIDDMLHTAKTLMAETKGYSSVELGGKFKKKARFKDYLSSEFAQEVFGTYFRAESLTAEELNLADNNNPVTKIELMANGKTGDAWIEVEVMNPLKIKRDK